MTEEIKKPIEAVEAGGAAQDSRRGPRKPSRDRRDTREPRVKPEFDQKIISIRRVTRVVTGGRRFSFSVAVVVGDRKGKVGVGQGKATDTPLAIDKAVRDAKKNIIKIPVTKTHSIPHEVFAKFSGSQVIIMRAPGKGIIAGSSVRTVLELAGIKEVGSKLFSRSKNKVNNAKAAIKALSQLRSK
ncbi:MAG: 30S ribosomal protein S5 [Candidatus Zambryskibacteria bacterium]|nr:30S ribosomal protein S5 [Candidatus Zambryskibacteria bacterium]